MPIADLVVENLSGGYGGTCVLEAVSFRVPEGSRFGIIGRNGAGKTTTLACIMGLAQQLSGKIQFGGVDISAQRVHKRAQEGLGYVPQTRDIFKSLTVEQNLTCAIAPGKMRERLNFAYQIFPRLRERRRHGGGHLSGGEQQMLAVARALVGEPRMLLLDEPLEGLAPRIRDELMDAIKRLVSETGVGCILVEQHVDVVLEFATQVLVLERGMLAFLGTPAELRENGDILDRAIGLKKS